MISPLPSLDRTDPLFRPKVDTFFGTQLPAFSAEAEAARVEINTASGTAATAATNATAAAVLAASSAATAAASANFKGEWSTLAGALATPASVLHLGKYWALVNNLANVAASTPGVSADWLEMPLLTLTGAQTLENKVYKGVQETGPALANAGSAYTVNTANGSIVPLTLNAPTCVMTFPTPTLGAQFTLLLTQDATGGRLVTWPSIVRHPVNGITPTLTTVAARTDVISFLGTGARWLSFIGGQNFNLP